ncbi:MAG: aldo/keto reductase [Firmicutes bacterium]|nr:aldo/keto reductase [Bacillota bacterium]
MEYRTLGKTGYQISVVSLGTWAIGGSWGRPVDEAEAKSAIAYAVDAGVNFFDTADVYGQGRAERLLGEVVGSRREVRIATKFGRQGNVQDPANYEYARVKQFAVESLKRLKRDTLDLYQVHCPPRWVIERGTVFEVLDRLQQEGLVRYYGVSVETVDEGLLALSYPGVSALQVIFNVFRQKPLDVLLPQAQAQNVGVLARVPLASGLLTGKFNKTHVFEPEDHRSYNRDGQAFNVGETFAGLPFEEGVDLVEAVRWMAEGRGSMARAALRWVIDQPGITSVIPGFKNSAQVSDNLGALAVPPFSAEETERLRAFYHQEVAPKIRGPY